MNKHTILAVSLFSVFYLGCVKQNKSTTADMVDTVNSSALEQVQVSGQEKEKREKEYQESRKKEEQEFQAMFRDKKWVVLSIEEYDSYGGYKWLWFETLDGGYFRSSVESISIAFDESLDGTYLIVSGVGRGTPTVRNDRYANQAVLYVSTRANKRRWDSYLKNRKEEIEKSESPREVLPPGKSK